MANIFVWKWLKLILLSESLENPDYPWKAFTALDARDRDVQKNFWQSVGFFMEREIRPITPSVDGISEIALNTRTKKSISFNLIRILSIQTLSTFFSRAFHVIVWYRWPDELVQGFLIHLRLNEPIDEIFHSKTFCVSEHFTRESFNAFITGEDITG